MRLKGALHVHSKYSDGEFALAELRELFLAAGCRFAFVTDHAEAFDANKVTAYVAECARLSDDRFAFVAGLEYECEQRLHVLGYGTTALTGEKSPPAVFRHIARANGVSVIAHPKTSAFPWIEGFDELPDGVEVWNSKYDGKYAPRAETFLLLHRLRLRRPTLRAFFGQDLHWRTQPRVLFVEADADSSSPDVLLQALAAGQFAGLKGALRLPASGEITPELLGRFRRVNARSARIKSVLSTVSKTAKRLGANIPQPIKAQLRRFL